MRLIFILVVHAIGNSDRFHEIRGDWQCGGILIIFYWVFGLLCVCQHPLEAAHRHAPLGHAPQAGCICNAENGRYGMLAATKNTGKVHDLRSTPLAAFNKARIAETVLRCGGAWWRNRNDSSLVKTLADDPVPTRSILACRLSHGIINLPPQGAQKNEETHRKSC